MYKKQRINEALTEIKEPLKFTVHKSFQALELILHTKYCKCYFVGSTDIKCIDRYGFKFNLKNELSRIPLWLKELWAELQSDDNIHLKKKDLK